MCIITTPIHKCGHQAPEDQKTYEYCEHYNQLHRFVNHAHLDNIPEEWAYDLTARCLAILEPRSIELGDDCEICKKRAAEEQARQVAVAAPKEKKKGFGRGD
jgi:hypothetical protein